MYFALSLQTYYSIIRYVAEEVQSSNTTSQTKGGPVHLLGTRIKEVRISSNLSQVQFAEKLGVKKQSVSNWENENVQPSVDMLRRIAVYYSCSTDFLLELDTSRIIVDVTGLTLAQRAHIQQLIDDLRYLNKEQAYRKQANKETE